MSNSQRAAVNERLYFCRIHLDSLRREIEREQVPRLTLEAAFAESILLHMRQAYYAYLAEIAEAYNVSSVSFTGAGPLIAALGADASCSAEAQECLNLEAEADWLAAILAIDHSVLQQRSPVQQQSPDLLTSHVDVTTGITELENYFNSLSALVENQRQRLEEW